MTAAMWLRNLGAFAIQAGVLVAAGAILARVLRIEASRAALVYWRALLLTCLLLPFCQPWHPAAPSAAAVTVVHSAAARVSPVTSEPAAPPARTSLSVERLVFVALCAGAAIRGLWLVMGAWVLGRIRRDASTLDPVPEPIARAQAHVGVSAGFYTSSRVAGPITFGVRRPVIVFPPGVAALDSSIQYAIACHELLHIRRRDWVFQIIEESIRTVVWFHPGIWWLIGRIQLTREQVVDREAAALLASREQYVEALLAVAIAKSSRLLTPAPAFFRRSLLKKRVAHILQESTMTTRRLLVSLGASAAALVLAGTVAVRSFPLEAQGQPKTISNKPVEIVKGGENLLHGELPEYPRRAIEQKVEGDVLLDLAVDDQGEVSDARVLSGPDELRKAALTAALDWHYSPSAVRSASIQATLRFTLSAANTEFKGVAYTVDTKERHGDLTPAQQLERKIMEFQKALEDDKVMGSQRDEYKAKLAILTEQMAHINAERSGAEPKERYHGPLHLVAFETERASPDAAGEVMKRAGIKIGDTITEESMRNLRAAAAAVDEHFKVVMHGDGRGGVSLVLVSRE